MEIELTAEEAEVLRTVVQDYISDLRMEIAGTEAMDLREVLKRREAVLTGLLRRLTG